MNEDELYFIGEAIRHARTLPFCQSVRFLNGMIHSLDDGHTALTGLRAAYTGLVASENQLDLIQSGQMKLNLSPRLPQSEILKALREQVNKKRLSLSDITKIADVKAHIVDDALRGYHKPITQQRISGAFDQLMELANTRTGNPAAPTSRANATKGAATRSKRGGRRS